MLRLLLLSAALAGPVDDTPLVPAPPQVRLPEPDSPIPPAPMPSGVVTLNADELYAFDSDLEVFVAAYPAGILKVTKEAGPLRVKARFAGNQNLSTKTFRGPFVYTVEAVQTGDVTLVVTPKGVDRADKILTRSISANVGPRPPPPGPTPPGPPPIPPPDPSTVTNPFGDLPGLRVLITFDQSNTTRPPGEQSVIYGKAVRDYLDAKCVPGPATELDPSGNVMKEYRIFPDNTDVSSVRPVFRDTFARRGGKDWIFIGNGKAGYSGPIPKSEQEAMALLSKFGGS